MTNEVINCIATHEYGYIASSVSVSLYVTLALLQEGKENLCVWLEKVEEEKCGWAYELIDDEDRLLLKGKMLLD